jgi:hypothetical protein
MGRTVQADTVVGVVDAILIRLCAAIQICVDFVERCNLRIYSISTEVWLDVRTPCIRRGAQEHQLVYSRAAHSPRHLCVRRNIGSDKMLGFRA